MLPVASFPRAARPVASRARTEARGCRWSPARPAGPEPVGCTALARPGVLVVEDEPLVRFLIRDALDAAGFDVADVPDADRALARLDAERPSCRVLVTDLDLGRGPDGLALAAEARGRHPALRVLFVTGEPERIPRRGDGVPTDCVLGKPFRCAELVATVRWLLAPPPPRGTAARGALAREG